MRRVLIGILLLLFVLAATGPAPGSALQQSDFLLDLRQDPVTVSVTLHISQNLTLLKPSYVLPQFHSIIEGANATQLAARLQDSLRLRTSGAQVSSPRLEVSSSAWSNQTNLQWFNMSLTFGVGGIRTESGGIERIDLSWKSLRVENDIDAGGFEVNNIGERYLVDIARDIVAEQPPSSQFVPIVYVADSRQVPVNRFPEQVARIATLNFTKLATPVSQWSSPFVPLSQTRSWSFKGPDLGMSFTRIIREPEEDASIAYGLFYAFQAEILAPAYASAEGDIVKIITSETPETLMGVTIIATLATGSGVFLYERRLLGNKTRKPKR